MTESDFSNSSRESCGSPRFGWATILITSFMVLTPWLMIALPGVDDGFFPSRNSKSIRYLHGWPFVWMHRVAVESKAEPTSPNFNSEPFQRKAEDGLDQVMLVLGEYGLEETQPKHGLIYDLRWKPDRDELVNPLQANNSNAFWTNPKRWPWLSSHDFVARRINWWGLILNLILMSVIFLSVAWLLERFRNVKQKFLVSLLPLIFATTLLAFALVSVRREFPRARAENEHVAKLASYFSGEVDFSIRQGSAQPQLLYNLCDNRSCLPLSTTPLFRPVKQLNFAFRVDQLLAQNGDERRQFVAALNQAAMPVFIRLPITQKTIPILKQITSAQPITIAAFRCNLAPDPEPAVAGSEGQFDSLKIQLELPKARIISIHLDSHYSQQAQLVPLLDRPHLENLWITNLNLEGAAYLKEVRNRLPKKTRVRFEDPDFRGQIPGFAELFEAP